RPRRPTRSARVAERFDAIGRRRMRREESAAVRAFGLSEPRERVPHTHCRISRAFENIHAMAIRGVLLVAAIRARDEAAGDRRQRAAPGDALVEDDEPEGPYS